MFSPSSVTGHFVAPVYVDSPRRLAVSGWFGPASEESGGIDEINEWLDYASVRQSRLEVIDNIEREHIYTTLDPRFQQNEGSDGSEIRETKKEDEYGSAVIGGRIDKGGGAGGSLGEEL